MSINNINVFCLHTDCSYGCVSEICSGVHGTWTLSEIETEIGTWESAKKKNLSLPSSKKDK